MIGKPLKPRKNVTPYNFIVVKYR